MQQCSTPKSSTNQQDTSCTCTDREVKSKKTESWNEEQAPSENSDDWRTLRVKTVGLVSPTVHDIKVPRIVRFEGIDQLDKNRE